VHKTYDRTKVAEDAFKGQITVLHFWEYQAEPLVEPYGQVGYLEFLYNKRRKLGVQVYGIAVDARLAEQRSAAVALKSIHKLKSFMNLDYAIAVDDGKLLAKFGDPTKYGAKLPLWVVIGPDGKIAHYHSGFYKIKPDEGLRELDDVLVKLIREQKGKPAGAQD
jgi:peroxiredoxin